MNVYVLLVWVFQESVIKMSFDLQAVYWDKLLWVKKWEVLEETGEGTGGESQYSSQKVLASRIGSAWVKVRGSWSPLSWEQACLSVPVLWPQCMHYSQESERYSLKLLYSHMWVYLYMYVCVCLHMDTQVCIHMDMRVCMYVYI